MTQPVANITNTVATGGASTGPFITYFSTVDPTPQNTQFPVQKRWVNTTTSKEFVLAGFNSAGGIVTANWLNISAGSASVLGLTGNSGGEVFPSAGNINVKGDGTSINVIGTPNTLTANVILPVTAHQVLVGETSSIVGVSPSTTGFVLTSNGIGADPSFQAPGASSITITGDTGSVSGAAINLYGNTAPATSGLTFTGSASTLSLGGDLNVAHGGTGVATLTAFAPVCGGTTSTAAVQQATTGFGSSGFVLTSTGAASLPTWQANSAVSGFTSIVIQHPTTVYTPTAGMKYCIVELVGGGGNGGGSGTNGGGGGGGASGYCRKVFSAADIGVSQNLSLGGAGTASTFGTIVILTANGGSVGGTGTQNGVGAGGSGGTASGGDINIIGGGGGIGWGSSSTAAGGNGGASFFGGGGENGTAGQAYGSGGGGGASTSGSNPGAAGAAGYCIVTEFI